MRYTKHSYIVDESSKSSTGTSSINLFRTSISLSIVFVLLITALFTGINTDNASSAYRPARVTGIRATYDVYSGWIGLDWFKSKGAKKYEVQVKSPVLKSWNYFKTVKKTARNKKKYGKIANNKEKIKTKYKLVATGKKYKVFRYSSTWKKFTITKSTEADYYVKKSSKYLFRVRAINKKKKGSFSGALKVTMNLKKTSMKTSDKQTVDDTNGESASDSSSSSNSDSSSSSSSDNSSSSSSGNTSGNDSSDTGYARLHSSYAHTVVIEASEGYQAVITRGPKTVTITFKKLEKVTTDMTTDLSYDTTVKIYNTKGKIIIDKLIPAFTESDNQIAANVISAIKSAYSISDNSTGRQIALATAKWMCGNIQYTNYTSTPAVQSVLKNLKADSEAYADAYAYLLSVKFGMETKFATDSDSHRYVKVNINKNSAGNESNAEWINVDVFKMDGGKDDEPGDTIIEDWFAF